MLLFQSATGSIVHVAYKVTQSSRETPVYVSLRSGGKRRDLKPKRILSRFARASSSVFIAANLLSQSVVCSQ